MFFGKNSFRLQIKYKKHFPNLSLVQYCVITSEFIDYFFKLINTALVHPLY